MELLIHELERLPMGHSERSFLTTIRRASTTFAQAIEDAERAWSLQERAG